MVARPAPVNLSISLIAAPAFQWYRIASICFRVSLPGRSVSSSLVVLIPPITTRAQERTFIRLAVPLFHPFHSSVRYRCRLDHLPDFLVTLTVSLHLRPRIELASFHF